MARNMRVVIVCVTLTVFFKMSGLNDTGEEKEKHESN